MEIAPRAAKAGWLLKAWTCMQGNLVNIARVLVALFTRTALRSRVEHSVVFG